MSRSRDLDMRSEGSPDVEEEGIIARIVDSVLFVIVVLAAISPFAKFALWALG